jgi:hypothetical protein
MNRFLLYIVMIVILVFALGCKSSSQIPESTQIRAPYLRNLEELFAAKDESLPLDSIIARHLRAIGGRGVISGQKTLYQREVAIYNTDTLITDFWYELGKRGRMHATTARGTIDEYLSSQCQPCSFAILNVKGQQELEPRFYTPGAFVPGLYGLTYYSMPGLLLDYEKNGIVVKRLDSPGEGDPFYELAISLPDDRHYSININPTNWLVEECFARGNGQSESMTEFRDFRRAPDGYVYPQTQNTYNLDSAGNVMYNETINQVYVSRFVPNASIPDSVFMVNAGAVRLLSDHPGHRFADRDFTIRKD